MIRCSRLYCLLQLLQLALDLDDASPIVAVDGCALVDLVLQLVELPLEDFAAAWRGGY